MSRQILIFLRWWNSIYRFVTFMSQAVLSTIRSLVLALLKEGWGSRWALAMARSGQTKQRSFGTENKQERRKIRETTGDDGWLRCRCQELNEAVLERSADDEGDGEGWGKRLSPLWVRPRRSCFLVRLSFTEKWKSWNSKKQELSRKNFETETRFFVILGTCKRLRSLKEE